MSEPLILTHSGGGNKGREADRETDDGNRKTTRALLTTRSHVLICIYLFFHPSSLFKAQGILIDSEGISDWALFV